MPSDRLSAHPAIFLVGTGVVGGALLGILRSSERPKGVWLAGVANRRGVVLGEHTAIGDDAIKSLLARPPADRTTTIDDALLDDLVGRQAPVLVDATAADGMESLYARALERGIHVVSANKKPFVCPWETRERLFDLGRREPGTKLRYEATVGAGLPVIETVKDLVRTGDSVRRIECVLSGTLGFLSNELSRGTKLSTAVAVAKERGYTEPDAREDLSGSDVARKTVILARELGAPLELGAVALEPFVPREVLERSSADRIASDLASLDAAWDKRIEQLRRRNEKLVYLARIERDPKTNVVRASAGPVAVSASHPAASLAGSSALVAFTTARYPDTPLVVSGSGAGGAVTASALLADVLKATGST